MLCPISQYVRVPEEQSTQDPVQVLLEAPKGYLLWEVLTGSIFHSESVSQLHGTQQTFLTQHKHLKC